VGLVKAGLGIMVARLSMPQSRQNKQLRACCRSSRHKPRPPSSKPNLQRLLSYEDAAGVLFGSNGGGDGAAASARAALSGAVARLVTRLLENLEARARGYRGEPALAAVFMMNNVHYAQRTVEGSPAERLLGREWLERHKDGVEEWGARYHDITWGPVLALLQVGGRGREGRSWGPQTTRGVGVGAAKSGGTNTFAFCSCARRLTGPNPPACPGRPRLPPTCLA
jgi:hypothetical protein